MNNAILQEILLIDNCSLPIVFPWCVEETKGFAIFLGHFLMVDFVCADDAFHVFAFRNEFCVYPSVHDYVMKNEIEDPIAGDPYAYPF